jgi:LPS O-antigen subunit length determinant protein (WzzB/FepE family)
MSDQNINPNIEDEISLKDIVDFLVESWKTIILTGFLGLVGSIAYLWVTPNQYLAIAHFQVARVADFDVEPPATLIEKLKMPMFYSQNTHMACNLMEKLEPGAVIVKTLKLTLVKNAPIITIAFQGESSEDAKKCLESVLDDVRINQNLLAKPILESRANQLLNMKLKLEAAERILKMLPKNNVSFDFSDSKFSASTLLLATTLSKESEIKDLRTEISSLEISLLEPQTKEAFLTTQIYTPKQKVSPKRTLIVLVGLMAGLFIGLLLMMGKRAYGAYKASH